MAERTGDDVGVEEYKRFTPPNVPTTSASTACLPLGPLDLNTRVPDTGTATPSRRRLKQSQRSANLAKKRQGTHREEGQRLHDAYERRTRRARQQQQANVKPCEPLSAIRFFCFLVPLRGTENFHKSIHLQSILLGTQRPLLTHTHKNKALASDTTKP